MPRLGMLKVSSSHYYGLDERKQALRSKQLYRCPVCGCRSSLEVTKVDRWISMKQSKTQEAITIQMPRLGMPNVS